MKNLKSINKKLDDLEQSVKWLKKNVFYISLLSIGIFGTLFPQAFLESLLYSIKG